MPMVTDYSLYGRPQYMKNLSHSLFRKEKIESKILSTDRKDRWEGFPVIQKTIPAIPGRSASPMTVPTAKTTEPSIRTERPLNTLAIKYNQFSHPWLIKNRKAIYAEAKRFYSRKGQLVNSNDDQLILEIIEPENVVFKEPDWNIRNVV